MRTFCLVVLVLATSALRGQDVASGPQPGTQLPALKVSDVTGPHQGKEVDYVAERKDAATVFLFVRADRWDRPMARFLKKLDDEVRNAEGGRVVAVWLTEDGDKTRDYLPRAQQSLKLEATALTYFPGPIAGPDGWGINEDAHLTAVVAGKQRVAAVFGYRSLNETNVPEVRDAFRKARGGN